MSCIHYIALITAIRQTSVQGSLHLESCILLRRKLLSDLERGRLDYIVRQFADEGRCVICIDMGIVRSSRHGHVCESFVDEVCVNVAIEIHHDTFSCQSLGAMTGDRVAVIEVPHLVGAEVNRFAVVHLYGELAVFVDALHRAKVAVSNT
jgi:hypothetical protein